MAYLWPTGGQHNMTWYRSTLWYLPWQFYAHSELKDDFITILMFQCNFTKLIRNRIKRWVSQFPLCLRNAKVLSHQSPQSSWFFLYIKNMPKYQLFKTSRFQFDRPLFGPKSSQSSRETGPLALNLHFALHLFMWD